MKNTDWPACLEQALRFRDSLLKVDNFTNRFSTFVTSTNGQREKWLDYAN